MKAACSGREKTRSKRWLINVNTGRSRWATSWGQGLSEGLGAIASVGGSFLWGVNECSSRSALAACYTCYLTALENHQGARESTSSSEACLPFNPILAAQWRTALKRPKSGAWAQMEAFRVKDKVTWIKGGWWRWPRRDEQFRVRFWWWCRWVSWWAGLALIRKR